MKARHTYLDDSEWAQLALEALSGPSDGVLSDVRSPQLDPAEQFSATNAGHLLAFLARPVSAPPDVKDRILERLDREQRELAPPDASERTGQANQIWKRWADSPRHAELAIVRSGQGTWEETGIEGIDVRCLNVDEAADRVTMMVRMAAGTSYPRHRHGGPEECYVLEGDLWIDDELRLGPGDYQRAEAGTVHGVQSTRDGCMLLIVSSLHDELVPDRAV